MLDQLAQEFMRSPQGQQAMSRLAAQGFQSQQAQSMLAAALPSAAQAFHQAQLGGLAVQRPGGPGGLMDVGNSHYVTNFLSGAVTSLLRGEGLVGAAADGLQGVVGGHVAQVIATQFGLPQRVAGTVGAIVTPLAIDWLWDGVQSGQLNLGQLLQSVQQQPGAGFRQPMALPGGAGGVSPTVNLQGGLGGLFANLLKS